ncbi:proline dehydrogenase [Ktedonosporobacter rubrisoli]|uniref:proline dehydrogenase n=1 Tax=Ktedonosporobacter rubrisoli TaxID=2509675 RepID=A0A4P6JV10_KTERU|nr:proline dehydrogenase family protein [Ktedonosporobacter rubrisoli]QBD79498.1 proline dehydrogenase [Ktedonosporobacter rubrisoli]
MSVFLKDTLLYLAQNQKLRDFVVSNRATRGVSRRFVAGEILEEAIRATRQLNQQNIQVALDHLGENVFEASEAEASTGDYIAALEQIKLSGVDANISIKLTALGLDISPDLCLQNMRKILQKAAEYDIFVCIDMEGSDYTERTVEMTLAIRKEFEQVGTVIQTYLYRSEKDVEKLIEQGVRIRLVKGAYKEPPSVAFQNKSDVDKNYVLLMKMLLSRGNFPAIASHDEAILREANQYVRDQGISKASFEFQMLYGIRRDLQEKLVKQEYNMRVYVPYGTQWYPYLMRRMAERPANLMFVVTNALR